MQAYVSCITDEKTVTITLPRSLEKPLCDKLNKARISTTHNHLDGCFHHPRHIEAASALKKICATDSAMQLPNAESLQLPLRSTIDAEIITSGSLQDIAIDCILLRKAHWFQTINSTLYDSPGASIISFGKDGLIPRSIALRQRNIQSTSNISADEDIDATTNGEPLITEKVAIIGMACRYPQADTVQEFWDLISSGQTAIGEIPKERFDASHITREPRMTKFWGNFLRSPDVFDHRFFNVSGREAKSMDPQQRLALQVAYEALESSGYYNLPTDKQTSNIGCYLGIGTVDYEHNVASENANAFSATGTLRAFASGRISHFFGWTGPSITFDTACSSSAVAIHTACKVYYACRRRYFLNKLLIMRIIRLYCRMSVPWL
jgi:hypothetical protein